MPSVKMFNLMNVLEHARVYLNIVNSAMGILEIEEVPAVVRIDKKGTTDEVFDKTSLQIITQVHEVWFAKI